MTEQDLSARIAGEIRDAIVSGALIVDARLPSEAELAEQFGVSRPTVREALKRLAAQNLIRTRRGATGGAFVRRLSFEEAQDQQVTTATLLLSMNAVDFDTACEARFALERACTALAAARRTPGHLARMDRELARQGDPALSDEAFCASDVAFHRALVDSAANPVLSYQLAGAIEAIEPLMNMIIFTARDRARILDLHGAIAAALARRDAAAMDGALSTLERYTCELAATVMARRGAAPSAARGR
ncbi:FadR/GntR family transcriptional regulator [Oceaniglobus roseus]|uniref:FadR/GntR family transcriptional regulator n=1 Tax=Oceaniglobus roseus TaxID=1737570 RepID=UPI000C7F5640|nr:GntR family transcriptional regulator [Kandeliimicrobium roseum]